MTVFVVTYRDRFEAAFSTGRNAESYCVRMVMVVANGELEGLRIHVESLDQSGLEHVCLDSSVSTPSDVVGN